MKDNSRRVLEIVEIEGYDNGKFILNPLIKFIQDSVKQEKIIGKFEVCGELKNTFKLI